jgi:hypothetical protein
MKWKLNEGSYQDQNKRTFVKNDIIETDLDLGEMFPNKFEKISELPAPVTATVIPPVVVTESASTPAPAAPAEPVAATPTPAPESAPAETPAPAPATPKPAPKKRKIQL